MKARKTYKPSEMKVLEQRSVLDLQQNSRISIVPYVVDNAGFVGIG